MKDEDGVEVEHWRGWSPSKRIREAARAMVPILLELEDGQQAATEDLRAASEPHSGPLDTESFRRARVKACAVLRDDHGRVIGVFGDHVERLVGKRAAEYQERLNAQINGRIVAGQRRYGIALTDDGLTQDERRKIESRLRRGSFVLSAMEDNERMLNTLREARKRALSG